MFNHRQSYPLPSLPPPLPSPPLPQQHLHFHPHGFHTLYHSAPPQPIPKFYIPTHVIQHQQYQQYQANRQRQLNNMYQQNSRRNIKKKQIPSNDTPNSMMSSTIRTKTSFSLVHSIKSSADWIAETFCFCFIDDNNRIIEMNRQTNIKTT